MKQMFVFFICFSVKRETKEILVKQSIHFSFFLISVTSLTSEVLYITIFLSLKLVTLQLLMTYIASRLNVCKVRIKDNLTEFNETPTLDILWFLN